MSDWLQALRLFAGMDQLRSMAVLSEVAAMACLFHVDMVPQTREAGAAEV